MTLLINTSTYISCVGLVDNGKIIKKKIWEADLRQSEELLPIIDKIVKKNKINSVIVVTGPGSYTGLRVGVATANALAYGWNCEVVGVNRFEGFSTENKNEIIILENINDLIYCELRAENRKSAIVTTLNQLCETITEPYYFVGQINSEKEDFLKQKLGNKVLGIAKKDDFDKDVLENIVNQGLEKLKTAEKNEIIKPFYLRKPYITKPRNS